MAVASVRGAALKDWYRQQWRDAEADLKRKTPPERGF